MSKTEIWVIQRNDGLFYYGYELAVMEFTLKPNFTRDINKCFQARQFGTKHWAEVEIRCSGLQNCRPVKVKISIVGGDDENR